MKVKQASLIRLLIKIFSFFIIFYMVLLIISLSLSTYIFYHLDTFKTKITNMVDNYTGYQLKIATIDTNINNSYLPELRFNNIVLINPKNLKQKISIKHLDLILSYSSLWYFTPIFKLIALDGIDLKISYSKNNKWALNGLEFLEQKSTNPNNFNNIFNKWILLQSKIIITQLNLIVDDQKLNLIPFNLGELSFFIKRDLITNTHHAQFKIKNNSDTILANIKFNGNNFRQWKQWNKIDFNLQIINSNNKIIKKIQTYIPAIDFLQTFHSNNYLEFQIKSGYLTTLEANFGLNNLNWIINSKKFTNSLNFNQVAGKLKINLNNNYYVIAATNLKLKINNIYILNNFMAMGNYLSPTRGQFNFSDFNLKTLNPLLKIFFPAKNLQLTGTLTNIILNWQGMIFNPKNFALSANFTKLGFNSKATNFPSLANFNGNIGFTNNYGNLTIISHNSTLYYPQLFLIPYFFKSLNTELEWKINHNDSIDFKLHNSKIITPDFVVTSNGSYHYNYSKSGIIDLTANLAEIQASKIANYLPKLIANSVHHWLNSAILQGKATNANLKLQGELTKFPFKHHEGIFAIKSEIKDAKLMYARSWPSVDKIDANFAIINNKIIIDTKNASTANIDITKSRAIIPDMTARRIMLNIEAETQGQSNNFINYLIKSPVNNMINGFANNIKIAGKGASKIKLSIPLNNLNQAKVEGDYQFKYNNLQFKNALLPIVKKAQGVINFSNNGIRIKNLKINSFNSNFSLNAIPYKNDQIKFNLYSNNLDYQQLAKFYLKMIGNKINGRAKVHASFTVDKYGFKNLIATSDLIGVNLDFPLGFNKNTTESREVQLQLNNHRHELDFMLDYKDKNSIPSKITARIGYKTANFKFNNQFLQAQGNYNFAQGKLKLIIDNFYYNTASINNYLINTENKTSNFKIPQIQLLINNFYINNKLMGAIETKIQVIRKKMIVQGYLNNIFLGKINFSFNSSCYDCSDANNVLELSTQIDNLGTALNLLTNNQILKNGAGDANITLRWRGKLSDFKIQQLNGGITLNLANGEFLKANPGIFGGLIGIINLQTITQVAKLDFNNIFSNGFYFNQFLVAAELNQGVINLKKMHMDGAAANVNMQGTINLNTQQNNLLLVVIPNLGTPIALATGLATTTSVATLNPVVGVVIGAATLATEWILGNPIGKLFSFSYKINGTINQPQLKKINLSTQLFNNINSAMGIEPSKK